MWLPDEEGWSIYPGEYPYLEYIWDGRPDPQNKFLIEGTQYLNQHYEYIKFNKEIKNKNLK